MEHVDLELELSRLIRYGLQKGLIEPEDRVYAVNRMLARLEAREFAWRETEEELPYPAEPLERICDWAVEQGSLEDTRDRRDQLQAELMDCMTPRPSEIVKKFFALYEQDKKAATDYYYGLSRATNYIRVDRVEKDRLWTAPTEYGDLVITINLSKPEKDPKAIAAAKNAPQAGYPKCALCRENEGFLGSANQAARGNHRLIPLTLCGEPWFLQYSPYVYYNEHCIVLSEEHRPMKVSRASFEYLLDFVSLLPHYFVGSNADLPIVGGSILSHDHFQGGRCEFPMAKAPVREKVHFPGFDSVEAGVVRWPMSVLRLRSPNKEELIELSDRILAKWREYSDESAEIFAYTGETPHNTITPIARRRGEDYELDLVLRNNLTTPEYPLGLYHPHSELHHIKKENIGLIEVMGLAVLPARLKEELAYLADALVAGKDIRADEELSKHADWAEELKKAYTFTKENAEDILKAEVGKVFARVLSDAGVYKCTPEGREAFLRFISQVK